MQPDKIIYSTTNFIFIQDRNSPGNCEMKAGSLLHSEAKDVKEELTIQIFISSPFLLKK